MNSKYYQIMMRINDNNEKIEVIKVHIRCIFIFFISFKIIELFLYINGLFMIPALYVMMILDMICLLKIRERTNYIAVLRHRNIDLLIRLL